MSLMSPSLTFSLMVMDVDVFGTAVELEFFGHGNGRMVILHENYWSFGFLSKFCKKSSDPDRLSRCHLKMNPW